ncbi:MAG: PIN domain-containing protein [Acidimicrobiia bacterium]|nr:PIN domain-containing protein [Acidimicrobiia bacterium]MDH5521805.1 PIN domain-containing protein [Acidimicrobiia bacterium]
MTLLLLDTTFLIDAERSEAAVESVISDDDDVAIAAVTVAELIVGVQLASGKHRTARRNFVGSIIDSIPTLVYDTNVAGHHAELLAAVRRSGRARGAHDLIIAATAKASERTVVTADKTAFADLPGVEAVSHR